MWMKSFPRTCVEVALLKCVAFLKAPPTGRAFGQRRNGWDFQQRRMQSGARPSLERGGVSSTHPHDVRLRCAMSRRQVGWSAVQ